MPTSLAAALELQNEPVPGGPIWVRFTVTNDAGQEIVVTNPDVGLPPPELGWTASGSAYQVGVLASFGLLRITLQGADGREVESKGLMPWVTPLFGKRALQPGESFTLDFDLDELFSIGAAGPYGLRVQYGDEGVRAEASLDFEIRTQP
jgi:hypothetical protein